MQQIQHNSSRTGGWGDYPATPSFPPVPHYSDSIRTEPYGGALQYQQQQQQQQQYYSGPIHTTPNYNEPYPNLLRHPSQADVHIPQPPLPQYVWNHSHPVQPSSLSRRPSKQHNLLPTDNSLQFTNGLVMNRVKDINNRLSNSHLPGHGQRGHGRRSSESSYSLPRSSSSFYTTSALPPPSASYHHPPPPPNAGGHLSPTLQNNKYYNRRLQSTKKKSADDEALELGILLSFQQVSYTISLAIIKEKNFLIVDIFRYLFDCVYDC